MSKNLHAIFEPGYVRSRGSFCDAEKGDLVSQHVLEIKMRGQKNLSSLKWFGHGKFLKVLKNNKIKIKVTTNKENNSSKLK